MKINNTLIANYVNGYKCIIPTNGISDRFNFDTIHRAEVWGYNKKYTQEARISMHTIPRNETLMIAWSNYGPRIYIEQVDDGTYNIYRSIYDSEPEIFYKNVNPNRVDGIYNAMVNSMIRYRENTSIDEWKYRHDYEFKRKFIESMVMNIKAAASHNDEHTFSILIHPIDIIEFDNPELFSKPIKTVNDIIEFINYVAELETPRYDIIRSISSHMCRLIF